METAGLNKSTISVAVQFYYASCDKPDIIAVDTNVNQLANSEESMPMTAKFVREKCPVIENGDREISKSNAMYLMMHMAGDIWNSITDLKEYERRRMAASTSIVGLISWLFNHRKPAPMWYGISVPRAGIIRYPDDGYTSSDNIGIAFDYCQVIKVVVRLM